MVAVGMNKAAEELMILDERTEAELASGRYRDQRKASFGTSASAPAPGGSDGRQHARPAQARPASLARAPRHSRGSAALDRPAGDASRSCITSRDYGPPR